jgi:sugar phosphate isomerase/epimerase
MNPGLSTNTYTWAFGVPGHTPTNPMTLFQLVDKAFDNHLKVIQIADNYPLHLLSGDELDRLLTHANGKGITIEAGTRGMTIKNIRTYLAIAKKLHSGILRVVIDVPGFEPSLHEILALLREIIPYLKEFNIMLAIENHDRFKSREFAEMVSETDPEWVGICLDSVNSMGAGEGIDEVFKTLAPYTINLHLKEFVVKRVSHKMGFVIEGCPLGQGMLPVAELVHKIPSRCRSAILEQWTPPEDTIEKTIEKEALWAEQSIKFLKDILQKK